VYYKVTNLPIKPEIFKRKCILSYYIPLITIKKKIKDQIYTYTMIEAAPKPYSAYLNVYTEKEIDKAM
jgi:hypothetical protein